MMAGGTGIDPDAQAFLNAAGITDATITTAINTLVIQLKAIGVWAKLKAIYPFVGGTASTHKFNLKDPRDLDVAFRLVFLGGVTHSTNGALPNGTNGYAETYLANNLMAQIDIHIAYYSRTNATPADRVVMGSHTGVFQGTFIYPRTSAGNIFSKVNNSAFINVANANSQGFYIATKNTTTFNQIEVYKNATQYVNPSAPASNHISNTIQLFRFGDFAGDYSNHQSALASIGDGLTPTEAANYYTAVQAFQTTLGRQV
jgi:hypothetical protein